MLCMEQVREMDAGDVLSALVAAAVVVAAPAAAADADADGGDSRHCLSSDASLSCISSSFICCKWN